MNGWSNLAGVIAGQLFKSRYGPHCMDIFRHPNDRFTKFYRSFPSFDDDDSNRNRSVWIHLDARSLDVGESAAFTNHADVDNGRLREGELE